MIGRYDLGVRGRRFNLRVWSRRMRDGEAGVCVREIDVLILRYISKDIDIFILNLSLSL
jgi:hypothetical protein